MKPVVVIVCDTHKVGPHLMHQAGDKYVQAVRRCSDVTPVLIPALDTPIETNEILDLADGVLFTGGYSNIERHHYGEPAAPADENQDPYRDKNTLALAPAVIEAGIPLLGICRGLQELNVALGGSLYPRMHEIEGRFDHREDKTASIEVQYGPAHSISVTQGGLLAGITQEPSFMVNSVHGQAINRLADALNLEAQADDSTIEAVSVKGAKAFALAVQWHPEWMAWENKQSVKIFKAFGDAARNYRNNKTL